jgi:hypothetical protein
MTAARYEAREFELVNFTDDARWVLRDKGGDIIVVDDGHDVEVRCERCGRWAGRNVAPMPETGRWVCHDTDCYHAEKGGA